MEIIREDDVTHDDVTHDDPRDINRGSYHRRLADDPSEDPSNGRLGDHGNVGNHGNGGPPPAVSRRKTTRSYSTPGHIEGHHLASHDHVPDHHGNHPSYHGNHSRHHDDDDDVPLLSDDEDWSKRRLSVPSQLPPRDVTAESLGLRTYKLRFYILFVFCLITFVNGMICYMWISVAKTVEFVYDMSDSELILLQNCAGVGFLIGVWPACWLLERVGLRWSVITCALVQFLGALMKIPVYFYPDFSRISFIAGTLVASLGGPLSLVAPTALSSTWFPSQERTISTALGAYSIGLGIGCIVVIEPMFLTIDVQNASSINSSQPFSNSSEHHKEVLFNDMMFIFYMQLALTALCLFLALVYFPNKPRNPPTLSASTQRTEVWTGLKSLLRSVDYHAMVVMNIQYSMGMSYQSALDVLLHPLGFSESDVGIMGGLMLVCGTFSAVLGGWIGYCFNKHLKLILTILFFFSGIPVTWFALTVLEYLPATRELVYASVILSGVGLNLPAALFFEAVIEQTYPVGEGVSISYMLFVGNFLRSALFALPVIPGIGIRWLNWLMIGCAFLPMPMLCIYKQKYTRLDLDLSATASDSAVIS